MADQLRLGDAPPTAGPVSYTLDRHALSKRYFALAWSAGEVCGISGPYNTPPAIQDLPTLHYDTNQTILKHVTSDILRKLYIQVEPDIEAAS